MDGLDQVIAHGGGLANSVYRIFILKKLFPQDFVQISTVIDSKQLTKLHHSVNNPTQAYNIFWRVNTGKRLAY